MSFDQRLTLGRSDVESMAWLAAAEADDQTRPDWLRADAAELFHNCADALLYQTGTEGQRSVDMVPANFYRHGHYVRSVTQWLAELPEQIREQRPVQVQMALTAAKLVDTSYYSVAFRRDALDALDEIGEALLDAAEALEVTT
jgi:uncharacterized caspase-like protein